MMTNQEVINVLVNMDFTIDILDQGVYDFVQTYKIVKNMMATSNNSLDEKISVINTILEINLLASQEHMHHPTYG